MEPMLTDDASKLMRQKLRNMSIEEFTDDARVARIYKKFKEETEGTIEDVTDHPDRSAIPNWSTTVESFFKAALARLRTRVEEQLTMPVEVDANSPLPLGKNE